MLDLKFINISLVLKLMGVTKNETKNMKLKTLSI